MSDSNLGKDGTIPNSEDGLALGHDPDGSHFNQEEEDAAATAPGAVPGSPASASTEESGSYTDAEGDDREDRPAEQSGSYTDVDE